MSFEGLHVHLVCKISSYIYIHTYRYIHFSPSCLSNSPPPTEIIASSLTLVVIHLQSSRNPEFVSSVKQEALKRGVTFVGPEVAAEVSEGNMETFTKLVEGTREAVAE